MSTHYEWVDTRHPFFSIQKVSENEVNLEAGLDDEAPDEAEALVLCYDEVVVVVGDLEKFAAMVVKAVYGLPDDTILLAEVLSQALPQFPAVWLDEN